MKYVKRVYFTVVVVPLATLVFIVDALKDVWWFKNTDDAPYKFWRG